MPAILILITIILNQNQKMHRRLDKETDLSSFKHSCIFYCMWGINIANHLTFIKYSSRNVKNNHEHLARDFHLFCKNKSMKCIVISQKLLIHLFNNLPMLTMEKEYITTNRNWKTDWKTWICVQVFYFLCVFLVNASSVRSI